MIYSNIVIKILIISAHLKEILSATWNYDKYGPDYWKRTYSACSGYWQSPININTTSTFFDRTLTAISFNSYNSTVYWNVTNNGFSVVLYPIKNTTNSSDVPYLTGSNFVSVYNLKQVIFHWGYNNYQGSEHQLNSIKYPLEMQLVHQNSAGSFTIVSFLFEIAALDNTALSSLLSTIALNASTSFNFNLSSIMPNSSTLDSKGYYRYYGSLTAPPCSEGITWSIYSSTISISSSQLSIFRNTGIQTNFRTIQKNFYRTVYTGIGNITTSAANSVRCSFNNKLAMLLIIILNLIFN